MVGDRSARKNHSHLQVKGLQLQPAAADTQMAGLRSLFPGQQLCFDLLFHVVDILLVERRLFLQLLALRRLRCGGRAVLQGSFWAPCLRTCRARRRLLQACLAPSALQTAARLQQLEAWKASSKPNAKKAASEKAASKPVKKTIAKLPGYPGTSKQPPLHLEKRTVFSQPPQWRVQKVGEKGDKAFSFKVQEPREVWKRVKAHVESL